MGASEDAKEKMAERGLKRAHAALGAILSEQKAWSARLSSTLGPTAQELDRLGRQHRRIGMVVRVLEADDLQAALDHSRKLDNALPAAADRLALIEFGAAVTVESFSHAVDLGLAAADHVGDAKAARVLSRIAQRLGGAGAAASPAEVLRGASAPGRTGVTLGGAISVLGIAVDGLDMVDAILRGHTERAVAKGGSAGSGIITLVGGGSFWASLAGGVFAIEVGGVYKMYELAEMAHGWRVQQRTRHLSVAAREGDALVGAANESEEAFAVLKSAQARGQNVALPTLQHTARTQSRLVLIHMARMWNALQRDDGFDDSLRIAGIGPQWFEQSEEYYKSFLFYEFRRREIQRFLRAVAPRLVQRLATLGAIPDGRRLGATASLHRRWTIRRVGWIPGETIEIEGTAPAE